MSVDTRTSRTPDPSGRRPGEPPRGSPSGFSDAEPVLSSVKVPSDPAQVVVNHASFRVQLAGPGPGPEPVPGSAAATGLVPARRTAPPRMGRRPATAESVDPAAPADSAAAVAAAADDAGAGSGRRRAPVIWSGRAESGDPYAAGLLDAARTSGVPAPDRAEEDRAERDRPAQGAVVATQLLPRVGEGAPGVGPPTVVGPRAPEPPDGSPAGSPDSTQPQPLLRGVRTAGGAYDGTYDDTYGDAYEGTAGVAYANGEVGHGTEAQYEYDYGAEYDDPYATGAGSDTGRPGGRTARGTQAERRQAYYPGRRMNLGVVLLPLRVFLGFISIYAGMGKLCDPVYFDGGERGSMVTWLRSLHPWTVASPLHDFALAHPVGSGLTVAFLQVIVGVLTMCGLWQRLAAGVGALLSAALLVTVSWSTVPAYDAPDIIYLAAWSPLAIAGAPVYSVDAKLATDAWRQLGPRVDVRDLRRRVLRRGAVLATVIAGLALLVGSLLGGAVRSSQTATVPRPGEPPTNQQPGTPLPDSPRNERTRGGQGALGEDAQGARGRTNGRRSAHPSSSAAPGARHHGRGADGHSSSPSQRETVQAPQQGSPGAGASGASGQQTSPGGDGPTSAGGTGGSGTGSSGGGAKGSAGGGSSSASGGSGGSSSGGGDGGNGGGLGGLLG